MEKRTVLKTLQKNEGEMSRSEEKRAGGVACEAASRLTVSLHV